jgi:hypothetical protein
VHIQSFVDVLWMLVTLTTLHLILTTVLRLARTRLREHRMGLFARVAPAEQNVVSPVATVDNETLPLTVITVITPSTDDDRRPPVRRELRIVPSSEPRAIATAPSATANPRANPIPRALTLVEPLPAVPVSSSVSRPIGWRQGNIRTPYLLSDRIGLKLSVRHPTVDLRRLEHQSVDPR